MLRRDPAHADAYFLLGMIALTAGNLGKALELVDRACALDPGRADYHAQAARCLSIENRDADAAARAERALELSIPDAATLDVLGVVMSRLGRHEQAAELFERASSLEPGNAGIRYNLGSSLRFLGRFDAAEEAYEAALRLEPRFFKAHSALSGLRTQSPEHNHVDRLLALLETGIEDVNAELHLRHGLAKEYEDLGEYSKAFAVLAEGQAKKRATLDYSVEDDRALFASVERLFQAETFAGRAPGFENDEPIFVVGMPRTGTTLVERILASHSDVTSAGELRNLGICVKRAAATRSGRVLDEETLVAAMDLDFAALGRSYIESTRPLTGRRARFVDKMPLNFFYVGLIHLALPRAKIICLRRNPMDTCLSNFRQLFALDFAYYRYAHDLTDIARYFACFDRLARHWQEVLPGRVLEVPYESLVSEPEPAIRRILDHCGLAFEPDCLAFERNPAPVDSASAVQVREPLNARSVGRWRKYAAELEPLRAALAAAGVDTDDRAGGGGGGQTAALGNAGF